MYQAERIPMRDWCVFRKQQSGRFGGVHRPISVWSSLRRRRGLIPLEQPAHSGELAELDSGPGYRITAIKEYRRHVGSDPRTPIRIVVQSVT